MSVLTYNSSEGGVLLDQSAYIEDLDDGQLEPQRASQKQDALTPREQTLLRGVVGKLNWTVQG